MIKILILLFYFLDPNKNVNGNGFSVVSQDVVDQIQRPSVDILLDELNNARSASPVYAVPHEEVKMFSSFSFFVFFKLNSLIFIQNYNFEMLQYVLN